MGITERDTVKTITTHYIDGAFVESHGREVMDIIRPTDRQIIGRVTLADDPEYLRYRKAVIDFLYTRQAHVEKH